MIISPESGISALREKIWRGFSKANRRGLPAGTDFDPEQRRMERILGMMTGSIRGSGSKPAPCRFCSSGKTRT